MSLFTLPNLDLASRAIRDAQGGITAGSTPSPAGDAQAAGLGLGSLLAPVLNHAPVSVNAIGKNTLVAGQSGMSLEIWVSLLYLSADQDLQFFNGALPLTGLLPGVAAGSTFSQPFVGVAHFSLDSGNDFIVSLSAAAALSGYVKYRYV